MSTVLAGVVDADASVRVLERALWEAQSSHVPLRVATAWTAPVVLGDASGMGFAGVVMDPAVSNRAAQELVDDLLAKALHERTWSPCPATSTETHQGTAGPALVDGAGDASLIVMGGRGHGPWNALLGSSTGYVLHHAACPVMIVPGTTAPGPFLRVVVGVDGAETSRAALRWAHAAARRHRCPLLVVHVSGADLGADSPREHDAALAWLDGEVTQVLPDQADVLVTTEVVTGFTSAVLLGTAGPDDLLVVGTRGRGGFKDLILGSVAMQCTSHARGAVVVVR